MIVDLSDLEKSCSVLAGGQSGNPASPHFNDQTDDWLKGNYHPMLVNHEEIKLEYQASFDICSQSVKMPLLCSV